MYEYCRVSLIHAHNNNLHRSFDHAKSIEKPLQAHTNLRQTRRLAPVPTTHQAEEEEEAAAAARAHWVGQFNATRATTNGCAISKAEPPVQALQQALARLTPVITEVGVEVTEDDLTTVTTTDRMVTEDALSGHAVIMRAGLRVTLGRALHLNLVTTLDLEVNVGRGMSLKLTTVTKHSLTSLNSPSWNMSMCRG